MWEAYGISDQGCVRQNNEDSYFVDAGSGLFVVADGMGGAQAGETASRIAIDTVVEVIRATGNPGPDALKQAFEAANRKVMEAASRDPKLEGMGTTLVAALAAGDQLALTSVGDSRAYVYDGTTLLNVTEDQSWVNEVGRKLGMDEASLRAHPMRHMLTMAIGLSSQLRIHGYSFRAQPDALVLLSSDGLHGVVPHERILALLSAEESLEAKAKALIAAAKEAGGPDNVTVILLRFHGSQESNTSH
jgi:protein phosphatase